MAIDLKPLANEQALDFWKDKVLLSPGQFAKLSDAAKIKAFAISGMAKGAELESVFDLLQTALEKGISYDQFKKELAPVWERRGPSNSGRARSSARRSCFMILPVAFFGRRLIFPPSNQNS